MNTVEARQRLIELTRRAIAIVECLVKGGAVSAANSIEMRDVLREAREVAYDAGFPGDAAWRALLRTNVYITTPPATVDEQFWTETLQELEEAAESLTGISETAGAG